MTDVSNETVKIARLSDFMCFTIYSTNLAYPLAEAARAHADMESRATTGKLLLVP